MKKYEYLDHTADIQIHAWGDSLKEAFENSVLAMFDYITEVEHVKPVQEQVYEVEGHDMPSLLYALMDEFLFRFSADFFTIGQVEIIEFDPVAFKIKALGRGEQWDASRHPQGTEIKAITYSNMQILSSGTHHDVYVIVDI